MSDLLPAKAPRPTAINAPENLPRLGEWFWIKYTPYGEKKTKLVEVLSCVIHVASNHIVFGWSDDERSSVHRVRMPFDELMEYSRPEPNWREVLQKKIADKQGELQAAVMALADACRNASVIDDVQAAPSTMLPAVTRNSPKEHKARLLALRDKTLPGIQKDIEKITKEMVALQKDLYLPERAQADKLIKATKRIDERLFALEIYAGLWEGIKQIAKGNPAPEETPITVRQMLLFMDEECLFDYDRGGMDYSKIQQFDRWIARKENRDRLIPEPRCIVAFQVRRHHKEYGPINSASEIFVRMEEFARNMQTYLLMRNGDRLYRLGTEVEFKPRLLPLRQEFHKPFEKVHRNYNWDKHGDDETREEILPDNLDYDELVEARAAQMAHYNRVLFLIQGLLDRSEVFRPHPPINLMDAAAAEKWFRPIHDEEDGLPSANPPVWDTYRDAHNAKIKVGSMVWATWMERRRWKTSRFEDSEYEATGVHEVTQIKRDRSAVRISWPQPDREGWQYPDGWYRGHGEWGKWPTGKKEHRWVKIKDCFNVSTYRMGDYKLFLCDHYLKGAYAEWAHQLLSAEKWHQQKCDPTWSPHRKTKNETEDEED